MIRPLDVAIIGCGTAGPALAVLLADQGHRVTVLEQAEHPSSIGAGILLQHLGREVLRHLGLHDDLVAVSRPVRHVQVTTTDDRTVMDWGYADVAGAEPALGVLRGALFTLLLDALQRAPVTLRTGVVVDRVEPASGRVAVRTSTAEVGRYDLVVGCDGVDSVVRRDLRVTRSDRPYGYGALWAIVDDPEHLSGETLHQRLEGTRHYLGVLPTGLRQSSLFWSARTEDLRSGAAARELRAEAARFLAPLLDRVDELLPATYSDVVVNRPYRSNASAGAVLLGDAAHAMSPQLGTGSSIALADAWTLAHHLGSVDLPQALARYHRDRRAHWRWYQLWSRSMVLGFQSELDLLAPIRDRVAQPAARVPWVRRQMVTTLMGHRTSPWTTWSLP